jgi:hypothetical protein
MQSPYLNTDSDNSRQSFKSFKEKEELESEGQVMCESCSLQSSQSSSSSSSPSSSSSSFSNSINFKTSPISSQESLPCPCPPPSQIVRVPTQDQPTQPVIDQLQETVQTVQTQKYPSNDIRFFLSSFTSTKKQKVNG